MKLSKINDPVIYGAIAGSVGGVVMEIINMVLFFLELLTLRASDFVMVLIKQQKATTILEVISGVTGHLLNAGISGVILLIVLEKTKYRFPVIKGAGMGLSVNFSFFYLSSFFQLSEIVNAPINTIILLHITGLIYGATAGYLLYVFHKNFSNNPDSNL